MEHKGSNLASQKFLTCKHRTKLCNVYGVSVSLISNYAEVLNTVTLRRAEAIFFNSMPISVWVNALPTTESVQQNTAYHRPPLAKTVHRFPRLVITAQYYPLVATATNSCLLHPTVIIASSTIVYLY